MQRLVLDGLFRPDLNNGVKGGGCYSDSSEHISALRF